MTLQRDFLDDYQLTTEEFAAAIRVSHERAEGVLSGRESIDADLALRLARLFGGSAEGWLNWQRGFELWHAHERVAAELDGIMPLDPGTRLSVLEDEPLDPGLIEELRRRMADHDDPRRWVVVSVIGDEEVPLHEEYLGRMFYNVENGCYSMDLRGATPFKSQVVAESVAMVLGEGKHAIEVTTHDLEVPRFDDAVDRQLRESLLASAGYGMSEFDTGAYLRDKADMMAYLRAATEDGSPETIALAVGDVMKAMTAQTTVEYLEARGALRDRAAYDAAPDKVPDSPCDEGYEG